jgi:hypothetical protein
MYSLEVPTSSKLDMKRIVEHGGLILLWFHAENEEPKYFPKEIPGYESGKLVYKGQFKLLLSSYARVYQNKYSLFCFSKYVHYPTRENHGHNRFFLAGQIL